MEMSREGSVSTVDNENVRLQLNRTNMDQASREDLSARPAPIVSSRDIFPDQLHDLQANALRIQPSMASSSSRAILISSIDLQRPGM